jgi:hypothetical protein
MTDDAQTRYDQSAYPGGWGGYSSEAPAEPEEPSYGLEAEPLGQDWDPEDAFQPEPPAADVYADDEFDFGRQDLPPDPWDDNYQERLDAYLDNRVQERLGPTAPDPEWQAWEAERAERQQATAAVERAETLAAGRDAVAQAVHDALGGRSLGHLTEEVQAQVYAVAEENLVTLKQAWVAGGYDGQIFDQTIAEQLPQLLQATTQDVRIARGHARVMDDFRARMARRR